MTLLEIEATSENTPAERLKQLAQQNITLQRLVAANPAAPGDLLEELATSNDKTTQKAIAANPNTPTKVLMKLGEKYPEELLENPVFALLQLENPNLILEIPENTLMGLLKLPTLPEYIFTLAAKRSESAILLTLANHPQTAKNILEKLTASKDQQVAQVAKLHVNWAGEIAPDQAINPQKVLSPFLKGIDFTDNYHEEVLLGILEAIPEFLSSFAGKRYKKWRRRKRKIISISADTLSHEILETLTSAYWRGKKY